MGDGSDQDQTPTNGTSKVQAGASPSPAALFTLLWDALVDLLGTAATAALLRRAAHRANQVSPELGEVHVMREGLVYRYTLPGAWYVPGAAADRALRRLVAELLPMLAELTGPVAERHLARVQELREGGIVSVPEERKLSSHRPSLERVTSGNAAFDRLLGGGLPVRSVNVIAGEPGAGKTIFALQMLFHNARQGKKCLYLTTLSEPSVKLLGYMQQFAFFDERFVGHEVVFADIGSVLRLKGLESTLLEITNRVESEEPTIVVIDSFKAMRDILGDAAAVRTFVYDLSVHTATWGATTLLVGEYTDEEIADNSEFAIADGIVRFSNRRDALTAVREVEILKLRGAAHATGRHFLEITDQGLRFFPRVQSPVIIDTPGETRPPPERVATGVLGLDEMLKGGLPHASTTVLQGGTGTGKTLLGLQFLLEGARRKEPGILFTLEETPDQLRTVAQGFGWDLAALERQGLLTLSYVSPVELSTDWFLDRARQQAEHVGARRAVLDSLTSMAIGVLSKRRFKELVYAFTKHFRALGVTLQMNMEVAELLGSAQLSGYGISFAADNVIQLKYVEVEGRLERGISVLKARGVQHSTEVRRMSLGTGGVLIGQTFKGLRGVLTGLPVRTGAENS